MDRPSLVSLDHREAAALAARFPEAHPELRAAGWSSPDDTAVRASLEAWHKARQDVPRGRFNVRDAAFSAVEDDVLRDLADLVALEGDIGLAARDPDVLGAPLRHLLVEAAAIERGDREAASRLAARVRGLPAVLEQGRAARRDAPAALVEWARHVATRAPALVNGLMTRVHDAAGEEATAALRSAIDDLRPALAAHERALDALTADERAPVAIGRERLDALLRARRLDLDAAELKDVARTYIEVARVEERRIRRRAFRSRSLDEASLLARTQTPYSLEEAASWSSELVEQSRAFIAENGGFPLRAPDDVVVEEGASGHGALFGAVSYLPSLGTRPARVVLSDSDDEIGLARFSVADLEASVARLVYPGVHLSTTLARRGDAPVRSGLLVDEMSGVVSLYARERVDGWGLFSESLMRELHFRDSPAVRLVTVQRLLVAALLAWYDVKLACGECSLDDVARGLAAHGAVPASLARRHALRLARMPSAGLSALVGRVRLEQLRRAARASWRHGYSDRRFHELVLLSGHIPVAHLFSLLDAFSPFNLDEGTAEYEIGESPAAERVGDPSES